MYNELDPVLNVPVRLAIVSALIKVKQADFGYLMEITKTTQGNLSHQIKKLNEAEYIEVEKTYKGNYPQTICRLTAKGKKAFENYVEAIINKRGSRKPNRVGINLQRIIMEAISKRIHKGPPLGILAIVFTLLFITGLSFVISLSGTPPYFPGPWESAQAIATYFQNQSHDVLMCAFFQFGSAIPLGLLTASILSRMQFLGVRASGSYIALFGGFVTA